MEPIKQDRNWYHGVSNEKFERVLRTGQGVMAGLGVKCYGRARFHMSCAKRCRDCC